MKADGMTHEFPQRCGKPLVELVGAGVLRNGRWLVRNIDLAIRSGEIVTLIGPNGSGKSTTAKLALGLLRPDAGKLHRNSNVRIGYVPQKLTLDWTMPLSVRRFMTLTQPLTREAMITALDETGIRPLIDANIHNLSGGEFQRLLLARAIARKPDLLVLDEPVQGVDFHGEIALYELINDIRQRLGCGILLISHDLHIVMAATDRVLCLNGHVCCQGTPQDVALDPAYQQLFGVRANETLAVYHHQHNHTHLDDGRIQHADGHICHHPHPHTAEPAGKDAAHVG